MKGSTESALLSNKKGCCNRFLISHELVFFSHESVIFLLLSGPSNPFPLCDRSKQVANLPLCFLCGLLFVKERSELVLVFDEIVDIMEDAEAVITKMHLAIRAPQDSGTVQTTRCPTMQLALGFRLPFGKCPVCQVSTQAHH